MKSFLSRINQVLILGVFLILNTLGLAQPQVTSANILALTGKEVTHLLDDRFSFNVNVGMAGENQIWDFTLTDIPNPRQEIGAYLPAAGTPFDTVFTTANFVEMIIDGDNPAFEFYQYFNVSTNNLQVLGQGIVAGPPLDTTLYSTDDFNFAPLPLVYNDSWVSVEADTTGDSLFMIVDVDTSINTIDGWGTLKLPIGDFSTLRIREDVLSISRTYAAGFLISVDVETWIQYTWVSPEHFHLFWVQSQFGETDPNFTNAQGLSMATDISTGLVSTPQTILPQTLELTQNYPNPFNPETTIQFSIPQSANVQITIYNALGQKVSQLLNERLSSGSYRYNWNAEKLPSGVYYYQVQAGAFSAIKKAILIK